MKKILFFNRTYFAGGVEKMLIDLVKELSNLNYDITIMVRRQEGDLTEQYLALESKNVHLRTCFDYLKSGKNIISKAKNFLTIYIAEKCLRRFPRIYYRLAIKDKYDVEIAFMHNEALAIIASSNNKKSRKISWVHTDLSKLNTWKEYFITRNRQKRYFEKYDDIVCVSQLVKDKLNSLLGVHDRVSVIYNPVDEDSIKYKSSKVTLDALRNKGRGCICAVGRLSWKKNFDMLIRAHSILIKNGIEHDLWIIGEGPERNKLEQLILELNVSETVTLFGFKENPYPYIKAADFVAVSSIYEGMSIITVEAFALGKPVVSSCPVTKEIFGSYDCGLLTENNEQSLAGGLTEMLTNSELREQCSRNAINRANDFNIDIFLKKVDTLLMKRG